MTQYRYPRKALMGDYLRAFAGLAITGGPALLLPTATPVTITLGVLAVLFGIFGLRTARRQVTVIEMSDEAITVVGAGSRRMAWRDVRQLRLDYYSTRRDSQGGWMQMKVSGPDGHIRVDSALDNFARLAGETAAHAAAHGVRDDRDFTGQFPGIGCCTATRGDGGGQVNGRFADGQGPARFLQSAGRRGRGCARRILFGQAGIDRGAGWRVGLGQDVVSQAIMGILPKAARISGGSILFSDPDSKAGPSTSPHCIPNGRAMRDIRGGRISIIFQEPMTSLSPLHTVGNQISEALLLHRNARLRKAASSTREMLHMVGFPDPARALRTYPFELSGGLRQRAMIAMALICHPALLIADEPTTALDVTIQAQILKQIMDLQSELGMAVLIITHDLGVVANVAEEVVVMYHGEVMESGGLEDIFRDPQHPYLEALLRAVPRFGMNPDERLVPIREIAPPKDTMLKPDREIVKDGAPILSVEELSKTFSIRKESWLGSAESERIIAVNDVQFDIKRSTLR